MECRFKCDLHPLWFRFESGANFYDFIVRYFRLLGSFVPSQLEADERIGFGMPQADGLTHEHRKNF